MILGHNGLYDYPLDELSVDARGRALSLIMAFCYLIKAALGISPFS